MEDQRPRVVNGPLDSARWARALVHACQGADAWEALSGILLEAVEGSGAAGGAILGGDPLQLLAVHGGEAAELQELLAAPPLPPPVEPGDISYRVATLRSPDPRVPPGVERLLVVPGRHRSRDVGSLVLFDPLLPLAKAENRAALLALAGLAALVVENERLYEEAREAQQGREHFLAALNHEIRTPATSLLLASDLLRSAAYGEIPPRLAGALRDAEGYVAELIDVLGRVLELGRVHDRLPPPGPSVIQPRDHVVALMRQVEPAARRKQLTLSLYVPAALPAVQTDVPSFSRVLLHLLNNAIKFTEQGGIEVRIERLSRRDADGRREPLLAVHVKDSGVGIPESELERILEPFAQVNEGARTNSRTRGLGLGLPMARQLARSIGGDISLASAGGQGTTATLTIPYEIPG